MEKFKLEKSLVLPAVLLFVLNFADWISSVFASGYAVEGNPLVVALVNQPPVLSLVFKMAITFLACMLLLYAYQKGPKQYAKFGFAILIVYYGLVVGNNLLLMLGAAFA